VDEPASLARHQPESSITTVREQQGAGVARADQASLGHLNQVGMFRAHRYIAQLAMLHISRPTARQLAQRLECLYRRA
ncbi:MAG TPA: hypothetical protein VF783_06610, partial [Terriglobales bacterium]